jgi:hypothetical protein
MVAVVALVGAHVIQTAVKLAVLQLKTHLLALLDTEQVAEEAHGRTLAVDIGPVVVVALVELEKLLAK